MTKEVLDAHRAAMRSALGDEYLEACKSRGTAVRR